MAATKTYADAWTACRLNYRRDIDAAVQEDATNLAIAKVWKAYDWRGTVTDLPPFWLQPDIQDYAFVPADFLGLREVYVVQPSGTDPFWSPQLAVRRNLPRTEATGVPDSIGWHDQTGGFRVHPTPSSGCTAPEYMIAGTYKKLPVKITRATLNSSLPFDDQYFDVVTAAFSWAAAVFSGSPEAAAKADFVFRALLAESLAEVGRETGDDSVAPVNSIMDSYGG